MEPRTQQRAERQAEVCGLFGNPTRVLILWALMRHEMNVSEIAASVNASLQSVSQHLRLMKDRGILVSRREGSSVYYRIQPHEDLQGCRIMELAGLFEPIEAPDLTSVYEKEATR